MKPQPKSVEVIRRKLNAKGIAILEVHEYYDNETTKPIIGFHGKEVTNMTKKKVAPMSKKQKMMMEEKEMMKGYAAKKAGAKAKAKKKR